MRKLFTILTLCLFFSTFAFAQNGKVFDNLILKSKILKMDRKYSVYLPADYATSNRSYPVLYLLHGSGDDHSGWIQFGEVRQIADKAIADGTATAMIIVMPDANTGQRGYFNDLKGEWNYEDFFFQEFIPFIEKEYRIRSDKRYRAISGLSMGGGGSFIYALHHPEMFSSSCPLSASCGPLTLDDAKKSLFRMGNQSPSDDEVTAYYNKYSVIALMNNMPEDQKKAVRWYIDDGDDDFLFEGNALVHIAMRKKEIPHEFRIRDGGHTWTYWRSSLPSVLEFVSMTFHQF